MLSQAAFIGAVLLLPTNVFSFGTVQGTLGQNSEHERITRAALACAQGVKSNGECFEPKSLDNLAGRSGTFGAVGSPDGSGSALVGEAHCDNADFLDIPGYPQNRFEANQRLTDCRTYLTERMMEGITNAKEMLNDEDQIDESEVDDDSCTFGPVPNTPGDAKCEALEGFGRALHGVQDVYSHSNWVDQPDASQPISIDNPPGLGRLGVIPWLDLRQRGLVAPEMNFTTGCFLDLPNVPCINRITHGTLNKDTGIIVGGATSAPGTPRGQINGGANFASAVAVAIADTVRLWRVFRSELKRTYGDKLGNKLICAMTRDDPAKDCQGRLIAIVIDSSGSNIDNDPSNLRITAGQAFNAQLISNADAGTTGKPDQVTVVDFDSSARVVYPLGDPDSASFAGIDSSGGTCIGCGLQAALNELTKDPNVEIEDRGGVVILTDGQDGNPSVLINQLQRAAGLGVRVNFGFLAPPANPVPVIPKMRRRSLVRRQLPSDALSGLLATGGIFATINSPEAQQNFINLVNSQGATNLDGAGDPVTLLPDLEVSGLISDAVPRYFNYNARSGESFTITITSREGQQLTARLINIRTGDLVAEGITINEIIELPVTASSDLELELEVTAAPGTPISVISVGLDTDAPTIPPVSSSAVASSSATSTVASSSVASSTVESSSVASSTVVSSSVSGFPSLSSNFTFTASPTVPTFSSGTGIAPPTSLLGTGTGVSSPGTSGTGIVGPVQPSPSDPPFPTTTTVHTTVIITTTVTTGRETITITKDDGATTCITRPHATTMTITQTIRCNGECHGYKTVHVPARPFHSDGVPPPRQHKCPGGHCPEPLKACHGAHCDKKCPGGHCPESPKTCYGPHCDKECPGGHCPEPPKTCHGPYCDKVCHGSHCNGESVGDGGCEGDDCEPVCHGKDCPSTHIPPPPPPTIYTPPPPPPTIHTPPPPPTTTCTTCVPPSHSPPPPEDCKKHNNCRGNTTVTKTHDGCGDGGCKPKVVHNDCGEEGCGPEQYKGAASTGKGAIEMAAVVGLVVAVIGWI